MRAGFQYAQRMGYEYACQLDADGQHDPREIETLIETASREHADVVIGSRFAGKGDYRARGPRKWAMNLFSLILSRVCKTHLSDTTSGFKLYGPRALALFAHNYPAEYLGDTIGALVIAARSHLVVREVGVQMHPRAGGEPSHNPIKSALFLVRATFSPGRDRETARAIVARTRKSADLIGLWEGSPPARGCICTPTSRTTKCERAAITSAPIVSPRYSAG